MHHYFNPYSTNHYIVASDYKATVDQRAKNMMIAVYKETDGNMRYYFNHWYDGDSVDEADNDCYLTIPWDMDGANSHLYQGWDGVMFRQSFALFERGEGVWIDDNGTQLTLHDTAAAMRSAKTGAGLEIFSAAGSYRYWMTNRILKWPKVVSSFDGQRKYIETATAADNHYPALHGLRLESLPAFQRKRFAYRDGYYQTGDLFKHFFQARVMGAITVKITAAQDGYFGMGVDSTSSAKYSCYLRAGESYTFTETAAGVGGKLIYIFGADKLSELDLSGCTPKNSNWVIADCTLLRKLIIGGESYSPSYTDDILSTLNLGQMPFLEEIDVRNTTIMSLNASLCPRLRSVLAVGSSLRTLSVAESSPVETLQLPAGMTSLQLMNLPRLRYPDGGLTFEGLSNVTRLQLSGCPNIDGEKLLNDIIEQGGKITEIYIALDSVSRDDTVLQALKASGARGIGSELKDACDGLTGRWVLTSLIDDTEFAALAKYFPELELYNAQYTMVVQDDTMTDPANVTNLDNGTSGDSYAPSGHILRIRKGLIPVTGKLNVSTGVWEGVKISESDYTKLANGSDFDYKDTLGSGNDAMMRCPRLWYKGINDFKNQKKYICWSSLEDEPLSTAKNINRKTLSDIILQEGKAVIVTNVEEGVSTLETTGVLTDTPNYNAYKLDVSGMKQVRWPGLNNASIGAVFLDENGIIIGKYNMAVNNTLFDFVEGEYIFIDVPAGAKSFVFASATANNSLEAIAVDSSEVEAIEPDWVLSEEWLGGIYHASIDTITQLRSISGATIRVGTGKSVTSSEWSYDSEGKPTNTPLNGMNYTGKDFQNLAARRGSGYQLFDYEMSKLMAILYYSLTGNRDAQLLCGYGRAPGGTTGYTDTLGNTDSYKGQVSGNKCLGFESFFGCTWEFMDNVAINVPTYAQALKDKMSDQVSSYPIDAKWHIFDPITKTERVVQGITTSGYAIARTKHGRYCDVIASKCSSDNSVWATNYCDVNYYTASRCRVVGRSISSSGAYGGLSFADANNAFSRSSSYFGSRLAFRGKISIQ